MKQCFNKDKFENIEDYQSLRMSGVLYLIGLVANCKIFDKEKNNYNEILLLKVVSTFKFPEKLLNRWKYYKHKNEMEKTRYAEGMFYDAYLKLINKEIDEEAFLKKISDLFIKEIKYLESLNHTSNVTFNFPVVEKSKGIEEKESEKVLQQIKKEETSIIRVTQKRDFFCFKNKKALYLNKNEKSEGIFIAGACGAGKTMASISLFSQIIIKGGGGFNS